MSPPSSLPPHQSPASSTSLSASQPTLSVPPAASSPLPPRSAYTFSQLCTYLSLIRLPAHLHPTSHSSPHASLALLTALHTHHISTIPYENLTLHYAVPTAPPAEGFPGGFRSAPNLDPQALYKKFVLDGRGRGGYCMENCIFFNHMLRACGFDAYTTGARIRMREEGVPTGPYIGWMHIVNIVTLHGGPFSSSALPTSRYLADVSFGGDGPTHPLPLLYDQPAHNLGTQSLRLLHTALPEQTRPDIKNWVYQYRNGPDKEWNSFYAFSENEWLHSDFEALNEWVGCWEGSFQTGCLLVVKFLRDEIQSESKGEEGGGGRIYGKRMMVGGVVKENRGGKTSVVKVCESEEDRVEALRECFGIELTEEERVGIEGGKTELRVAGKGAKEVVYDVPLTDEKM